MYLKSKVTLMFVVRQLNNKYRLHNCTENVFLKLPLFNGKCHYVTQGAMVCTENLDGGIL